jgi:ABC-type polysaccharide/polyol phosphate transport system ATPase subunit
MAALSIGAVPGSAPDPTAGALIEIREGARVRAKALTQTKTQAQAKTLGPDDVIFSGISLSLQPGDRLAVFSTARADAAALVDCISGVQPLDAGTLVHNASVSWPLGSDDTFNRNLSGYLNALFAAEVYSPLGYVAENLQLIQELTGVEEDTFHLPLSAWSSAQRELLKLAVGLAFDFDVAVVGRVNHAWDHRSLYPLAVRIREVFERRIQDRAMVVLGYEQEALAMDYCNRAILLQNGAIIHEGTPQDCSQLALETILQMKTDRRQRVRNRAARLLAAASESASQVADSEDDLIDDPSGVNILDQSEQLSPANPVDAVKQTARASKPAPTPARVPDWPLQDPPSR